MGIILFDDDLAGTVKLAVLNMGLEGVDLAGAMKFGVAVLDMDLDLVDLAGAMKFECGRAIWLGQ